jgi:hypothetical protein
MALPYITASGNWNVTPITGRMVLGINTNAMTVTDADVSELQAAFGINQVVMALSAPEINDDIQMSWVNAGVGVTFVWDSALGDGWYNDGTHKSAESFMSTAAGLLNPVVSALQGNSPSPHFLLVSTDESRASLFACFVRAAIQGAGVVNPNYAAVADATWTQIVTARPTAAAFNTTVYRQSCLDALTAFG